MGNSESRQIATVLSTACQGADDNFLSGRQQDPEVLVVLGDFLRHVELVWDKLPVSFTDVIKSKFLPRFTSSTDPEVWVIQQTFCKSIDNPATYIYNQLTNFEPRNNRKTPFEVAKDNLWLVAFARLRKQYESTAGRGALAKHLTQKANEEEYVRNKCGIFASAGQRLESAAIEVGGNGALICGLAVPYSTLTTPQRFKSLKLEDISRKVNRQSSERCEAPVAVLLSLYERQMHSWMAREREDENSKVFPKTRGRIVATQVVTSGGRKGHATLIEPSQSGVDDCPLIPRPQHAIHQLHRAQSQRTMPPRLFAGDTRGAIPALLVPENLLRTVKLDNKLCSDFDSYCFNATLFIEKGLPVAFRRSLSRATALVEHILQAEHPRTLACFLEVFIHLIQTGLHGERASMGPNIELGMSSRFAVSVRLDYIKRVVTNHFEEERLLRDLLAQFGNMPRLPTPRVMLNLAHNLSKQARHVEAEKMALESL
ncbi:hypothetical protein CGGC5_v016019 [Colletotrichum fructicola Nara gc5]|uniref:Uncharacterized protein n=1 Tax=Colletotrichum fructicola (strain Nara gc5) TaxID=1213859 RepID=A0A7J6II41_COLFN|nr:hypothetical protein CGGC5_v016019 [Colletotrichum fructicola Nara gc5]